MGICCGQRCWETLRAVVNCLTGFILRHTMWAALHPPPRRFTMARSTQKTSTDRPNLTAAAPTGASKRNRNGLPWKRYFTRPGVAPFEEVQWETREASITNEKGEVVFEQHEVEIPTTWSQVATNVVVSKYFRGVLGTPERERSVKQLIGRVV